MLIYFIYFGLVHFILSYVYMFFYMIFIWFLYDIHLPSAFPPPCRIRVLVSPVARTVPGPLSPKTFQKQNRMLAFFWFFSSASTWSCYLKITEKLLKIYGKSTKIEAWGGPGGLLGDTWVPFGLLGPPKLKKYQKSWFAVPPWGSQGGP